MKVKVIKNFKDKHTGEFHKTGKVMNISKKRYEEILTVGKLVEEYKETVDVVATDNVPDDAEVAEGVDVDADEVVIKDENGNVLDTIADETAE